MTQDWNTQKLLILNFTQIPLPSSLCPPLSSQHLQTNGSRNVNARNALQRTPIEKLELRCSLQDRGKRILTPSRKRPTAIKLVNSPYFSPATLPTQCHHLSQTPDHPSFFSLSQCFILPIPFPGWPPLPYTYPAPNPPSCPPETGNQPQT